MDRDNVKPASKILVMVAGILAYVSMNLVQAGAIRFSDYILLQEGMSEGEILLRVGPPDRETVIDNFRAYKKIWYYIPDGSYSGDWLTIITIGANGRVIAIEREKP